MAASFRTVRNNTLKIADEIDESSYGFRAAEGSRTIGQTLMHIAEMPKLQMHIQGTRVTDLITVDFQGLIGGIVAIEREVKSKADIISLLRSEGERFAVYLEGLAESFLAESVNMFPGTTPATKSRLEMLLGVKEHEMHHRAQLMTLQRILGLTPHLTRARQEQMAASTQK